MSEIWKSNAKNLTLTKSYTSYTLVTLKIQFLLPHFLQIRFYSLFFEKEKNICQLCSWSFLAIRKIPKNCTLYLHSAFEISRKFPNPLFFKWKKITWMFELLLMEVELLCLIAILHKLRTFFSHTVFVVRLILFFTTIKSLVLIHSH